MSLAGGNPEALDQCEESLLTALTPKMQIVSGITPILLLAADLAYAPPVRSSFSHSWTQEVQRAHGPDQVSAPPRPIIPRKILTLADALEAAERYNPQLQVAAARVESARAGILTAGAYPNPELTFGSMGRQRAIQLGTLSGMLHGFTVTQ